MNGVKNGTTNSSNSATNGVANGKREAVFGADASEAAGLRTVVLASADAGLRQRLRVSLTGLRWQVREASGGAEAMAQLEDCAVGGASGG